MVTKVDEFFPPFKGTFANDIERKHRLDALAIARLQGGKTEFSCVAGVHNAAGQGGGHSGRHVDTEALEAAGGLGSDRTIRSDSFWETPDAIWRLDQFHEHCGLDLNEPMARKFRNDEVINRSILIFIQHTIDENDPSRVYANVTKTAPAE
jgi:hypothetical protein